MTWHAVIDVLKFWLPLLSALGLVVKVYYTGKKLINNWLDRMGNSFDFYLSKAVDNHMSHFQADVNRAATAVENMAGYHKESLQTLTKMQLTIHDQQIVINDHMKADDRVQNAILTDLEVIKAKL